MAARAVWRPRWYAWALLGLTALAGIHYEALHLLSGHGMFVTPCLLVVGLVLLRRAWELPPAIIACAAIGLTIFSGGWSYIGLGGLPLDRLLIALVLLAVLLRAPGVMHAPRLQLRNVHLLLCVTILYAIGSAAASGTLANEASILTLTDQFGIVPYLMFLVAPAIFAGKRERDWLLATLLVLGAYLGFTAIFESLGPHALVFPSYIAHVDEVLPEARAGGPFQSSVAEGFATFACAVAAAIAFVQWRGRRRRIFAAVVGTVCILGCFLTLERGVWIAAIAAVLITSLTSRAGRRVLVPGALACTLLIGGALALSPALAGKVSTRVNNKPSIWARQDQTAAGLRMLEARPLFGFGWNRFTSEDLAYFRQADTHPMTGYSQGGFETTERLVPLHNTYLGYAVELGLVGALLWLASLLWGVGGAIVGPGPAELRPWKAGLLAIAVFFLVVAFFNPYQLAFPVLVLWTWAGVALGRGPSVAPVTPATSRVASMNVSASISAVPGALSAS
jgi:putative inorganic carbon (HCO3(-)) transporter